jgi:hypothetical protein
MVKKTRQSYENGLKPGNNIGSATEPFIVAKDAVDPNLAILFASSVSLPALILQVQPTMHLTAEICEGRTRQSTVTSTL